VVVLIRVDQVVCDEVCNSLVSKSPFDYVNSLFSGFADHGKFLDLLDAREGLLFGVLSGRRRCRVQANDSVDIVREQSRCHHGSFGTEIVADEGVLVEAARVCKPGHVSRHLLVAHALVVIRLAVVAQVNQKDVSLATDSIVEGEVAPHATLAHETVQEQNCCSVWSSETWSLERHVQLSFALVALGRGDFHAVELDFIAQIAHNCEAPQRCCCKERSGRPGPETRLSQH